jgi:hypothetical protein
MGLIGLVLYVQFRGDLTPKTKLTMVAAKNSTMPRRTYSSRRAIRPEFGTSRLARGLCLLRRLTQPVMQFRIDSGVIEQIEVMQAG